MCNAGDDFKIYLACVTRTWKVKSDWLNIYFIHGDIHRSYKKNCSDITFYEIMMRTLITNQ